MNWLKLYIFISSHLFSRFGVTESMGVSYLSERVAHVSFCYFMYNLTINLMILSRPILVLSTNIWQGMTIMSTMSLLSSRISGRFFHKYLAKPRLSSQIFGRTALVSWYLCRHDTLFLSILSISWCSNTIAW